nr:DUF2804 domain-containing protein [uncultured Roseateles sp.]
MKSLSTLPAPPPSVVADGAPASGRYAGRIAQVDWRGLRAPFKRSALWRRFHHKRWQYLGLGNEAVFIGLAIVDVGWTCTAFAYVFDRKNKRLLADWSQDGLPGLQCQLSDAPVTGALAWFQGPSTQLSFEHSAPDCMQVKVKTSALTLQVEMDLSATAPWLLAVGSIGAGGVAHATQKSSALPVRGQVQVQGQTLQLDDAWASIDSSNGLLARHTEWRWACAHRPDVGFNLQNGYFGGNENSLWLNGGLIPLGAAHFEFDAQQPLKPWRVSTADGLLDLRFSPEGARQQNRNLLIAASRYIQPIGTFSGWVKPAADAAPYAVSDLLGVTEDHRSTW